MSLLTGQIANEIFKGFKGKLLTGLIRIESPATLDEYGDAVAPLVTTKSLEGFISRYSEYYHSNYNIPNTDLKVNIFAKSMEGDYIPTKDDKVQMNGVWYQLRNVKTDPATAMFICQAFPIKAP